MHAVAREVISCLEEFYSLILKVIGLQRANESVLYCLKRFAICCDCLEVIYRSPFPVIAGALLIFILARITSKA